MTVSHQTFARKKPDQLVYLELGSGNGGMLLAISDDGFRFRAVSPLRANNLVPFAFSLDGTHRLQGIGEVEWLEDDGKSGGMRFSELSEESRTLLRTWLALGDQRQSASGREPTPAAATPLDTMEKIREELRRGYPARPSSETRTRSAEQTDLQKLPRSSRAIPRPNRPVPEKSPSREERAGTQPSAFHKPVEPIEEVDPNLPPPPTAVPILERLMGPRRGTPPVPENEQLAEQNNDSSPNSALTPSEAPPASPGPPPFTKPAESPNPARAPFSISAFLKGNKESSHVQRDTSLVSGIAPGPTASPTAESAEPLSTLRSFTLSDSGEVDSPTSVSAASASRSSLRAATPKNSEAMVRSTQPAIPPSPQPHAPTNRPYIPPPDTSFDAAWERARLSVPPQNPHLSRAAASAIIGLALAVIIGALAYNFRQDIGAIIIGVGQKVSGEAHSAQADSSSTTTATQSGNPDAGTTNATSPSDAPDANAKPAESSTQPAPTATPAPGTSQASVSNKPSPSSSAPSSVKKTVSQPVNRASNPPVTTSGANNKDRYADSQRPAATATDEQSPEASAPAGSGQEEFDAARDILNGANRQRDLQTAVALLWSGVRKGYVPAEVTLADLYRRGEGVEKNCDQAQVLLVAASRKGSPDARRLLESMAEQGCQ